MDNRKPDRPRSFGKNFYRFVTLKHYSDTKLLRWVGGARCLIAVFLLVIPRWFNIKDLGPLETILDWALIIIAGYAALNLVYEYLLYRRQLISIDYVKDKKRQLIQHILNSLLDIYEWKDTCRATLFVKTDERRLEVFERVSVGFGSGDIRTDCFFTYGCGLPGIAWKRAWSGDKLSDLLDAIQVANIPKEKLGAPEELSRYFANEFNVPKEIFECLGDGKYTIESYLSVGILDEANNLACVLAIDSHNYGNFTDIERLKQGTTGLLKEVISGGLIHGELRKRKGEAAIPETAAEGASIEHQLGKLIPDIQQGNMLQAMTKIKEMGGSGLMVMMERSKDVGLNAEPFLAFLAKSLKDIRFILRA